MIIRLAAEADIPKILDLLLQVGQVHHQLRPDIFRAQAQKYNEEALKALLKDESRPIYVAEEEDGVAGYCFCVRKEFDDTGAFTRRRELYIDDLCVDAGSRGRGVATALYRHVRKLAGEMGCAFVTLNVWCGNENAWKCYEKMGLRPRSVMMEVPLEEETC